MTNFFFRTILLLLLFILKNQTGQGQDYGEAISKARFLISAHQLQTNIPGIQIAVMIDGKLVWSEGIGYQDLSSSTPVTTKTKFRIASISKSVTSMALGKLVEQKLLDLDLPIDTYLPSYPKKSYPITARQLAASTSGTRHYGEQDPKFRTEHYDSVGDALSIFENDPLLFEPNSQYHYSSYGWILLSAVMEAAFKKEFKSLMEKTWGDLDMNQTYFDDALNQPNDVTTHYIMGKKEIRTIAPYEDRSYIYAGGGFLSTAEDLVNMGHQLISDSYLQTQTRKLLTTSQLLINSDSTHYGLGWETGKSRLQTPIIFHSGSLPTARTHLVIYPNDKVVLAYLSNTGEHVFFNDREAQSIAELFVHEKSDQMQIANQGLTGDWVIETTSLRNKKHEGMLTLWANDEGVMQGNIKFRRSKKMETYPILLAGHHEEKLHFIAVSPMFIDLFVALSGDLMSGYWLHDFNVKGTPEEDPYWAPRVFKARKSNQ